MTEQAKPNLTWTSHPLVDDTPRSIMLLLIMIIVSIILYHTAIVEWNAPIYFYLGMLFFIGSLISWFIPTRYELYDDKIMIFYWRIKMEKNWNDFRCWYADKKGVMLGTFTRPRRLDNFRGQSLRFSKTQSEKEALFRILENKIGNKY